MSIVVGGATYSGVVIGGVECLELTEGLAEGIDDRGPYATKKYLCDWANRYALANAMLGFTRGTGGQGGSVQFTHARTYPESPNLFADRVAIEGRGRPSQGTLQLAYPFAVITVEYGVPPWRMVGDPNAGIDPNTQFVYATQDIDSSVQLIPVPNSALTLVNGHRLDDEPFTMRIPNATISITLHRVPFIPWPAIWNCMQAPISDLEFLGIDPFYLFFDGAKTHEEFQADGSVGKTLTLGFRARAILAWDEVFDKDGVSGPQQVLYNGSPIYETADFRTLIPSNYFAQGGP
jgi:hypothetical protein